MDKVLLDYGSGGRASHRFVADLFFRHLGNDILARMDDAAVLALSGPVAMSTDSFVVDPIFFPGGDIGSLAVHGTVNDVAMMGARPLFLTCGFILEEGLPMADLERIVASMGQAAREAGVRIVAGDTKVVPRGAADKIFINTTGLGEILVDPAPGGHRAAPGDAVLVSGSMGDHGLTILSTRQGLSFDAPVASDSASLGGLVSRLLAAVPDVHVLRDPTRGGLATTLNEIAGQSGVGIELTQAAIPVTPTVAGGCAVLGLDPLYLANEGKCICIVPEAAAPAALDALRADPLGAGAAVIGRVVAEHPGKVALVTPLGGKRLLGMLEGEQLPRIC
ncbi:MAG: hydrogenase expression/formation protein HypE [Solidesulfovibrio sp.]|uniref:hydrogenase expression/formation protein HypE n=1 Tax=Solidesulfovibrio sp. TaxID=2910990 RepID=UPI002B204891|nr:hydrogenase expression/formation protein HypE [Solidesulfovibrio sp.]MEA4857046.1 hydrogenase expression/formation protein HypE [Solidesulfovibrio sp.]